MKRILLILTVLLAASVVWATPFFTENFDYTAGTALTANGWTIIGTTTTNPINCTSGSLSLTGYPASGVGNATSLTSSGQDIYKDLGTTATSGSVFVSFLMNISAITSTAPANDYFLGCLPSNSTSNYTPRIAVVSSSTGKYKLALMKMSETVTAANQTTTEFDINHTYVVVFEYKIVSGTTNDEMNLWVYDSNIPSSLPTAQLSYTNSSKADASNIARIFLRQGTATPTMVLDGFQAATAWSDLFPGSTPTIVTSGTLNAFAAYVGQTSASQSYTLSGSNLTAGITVSAPAQYKISSDNTNFSGSLSLPASYNGSIYVQYAPTATGTHTGVISHVSTGATQVDVSVSGTATEAPSGQIAITSDTLPLSFTAYPNVASSAQSFTVAGQDLTDVINTTVSGPFEISLSELGPWDITLDPALDASYNDLVYVRYKPTAVGTQTGTITFSSQGAADAVVTLSGVCANPYTITANPTTLTYTSTTVGTPVVMSYTLSGSALTENITVTAPTGFGVSTSETGTFTNSISVASSFNGSIYVQYAAATAGTVSGNVSNVANGITTNVAVSATATLPETPMNIAVGQTLTQNFDLIGVSATATLPTDWKADKNTTARFVGSYSAAASATDRNGGNAMSSTAGNGIYNYAAGDAAAATDRAIGFLSSISATKSGNLYTKLTNTGSTTITAFDIAYNVEKYRGGTNAAGYTMKLYYSTDGATWSAAPDAFVTNFAADATTDGYTTAPGVTQAVSGRLITTIPAESNLYLAWNYSVTSGTTTSYSQGLGVDDISITAVNLPIASAPTFTPAAGFYTSAQTIELATATDGATIYYTVDGSDPTTSSNVYSTGFTVSANTTVKAIAVKSGLQNSPIASAIYSFPVNVATISTLRSQTAGTGVVYHLTTEAVLTMQSATRNTKYVQDATGAIVIDDPTPAKITSTYNVGDGITGLLGTIALYNGMLQFTPIADPGVATSTGNVIVPQVIAVESLTTDFQAKLVKVTDITITNATLTTFVASNNYTINGITTTPILRTQYGDLDYIGTALPTGAKSVVGVVLQYGTVTQFVPRSLADFEDATPPDSPSNVTIETVETGIHLHWDAVTGATSYIVEASDSPTTGFTQVTTSTGNDAHIIDGATYAKKFFRVITVK